ncbi:MAG: MFS transporter [Acidimicrobiales bacterium]|nr:MFS transporter [Acidimicrobiales bacterium]
MTLSTPAAHRYRWVMFAGMVGVYFAFGIMVSSIPPMVTEVRTDLGMGRGAMGLALSAWTAMYIVTAAMGGRLVDRLGIGVALALGGLSVAATGLARSFAQGPVSLWLAVAIMGIGGPLVSASAPTLCGLWFSDLDERQFAMSVYNLGPGIGSILAIFATNSVLLPWLGDWRAVLRFEAAVAVAATTIWVAIAIRAPRRPQSTVQRTQAPVREEWSGLLRSADVRFALMLGAMAFFVMHSLNNWLVDAVSEGAEISAKASSNWIAGAGALGLLLLFVVPRLATRFGRPATLVGTYGAIALGVLLVGFGPPPAVVVGVFGTAVRATIVPLLLMTLISADAVDETNMGAANGLWFSTAQIGAVAGPFLVGAIADTSAGFGGSMLLLAAMAVLTATLIGARARRAALR